MAKFKGLSATNASFDISGDDDDCEIMLVLVDLVSDDEAEENAKSIETDDDVILEINVVSSRLSRISFHLDPARLLDR